MLADLLAPYDALNLIISSLRYHAMSARSNTLLSKKISHISLFFFSLIGALQGHRIFVRVLKFLLVHTLLLLACYVRAAEIEA